MGSITERKRKDGQPAFMAQVVIKRAGRIAARENKTFDCRREAALWIAQREVELNRPGGLAVVENPKLADVIDRYLAESKRQAGKTKSQVLAAIKNHPLAAMRCDRIHSKDIVAFAQGLADNVKPQTVGNYLSHLASIFAIAEPAWGYPLKRAAMLDAIVVAKRMGYTSRSVERTRRPTLEELDRLLDYFAARDRRRADAVPMAPIMLFAAFSTRRQDEICRIRWDDLDADHGRVMVRDMKHPGEKIGNDQWVDLPPEALAVIRDRPRRGDRIFPHNADSISTAFTNACKILGIDDLHFHDLRHDGISRLFELGWTIPHVAAVSGHRSWASLKRYTHLKQRGDKFAGWKWNPKKSPA